MTITIDRADIAAAAPALPAGWAAVSNAVGGSVAPADGRIGLTVTATAHDTITASSASNNAVCIEHALADHGGPQDIVVRWDTDTSDVKAWGINLLMRDGTGGWARWCVSKGNDNTERPNFFVATRPAGGAAGTNHTSNQNVNTSPHRLQSGAPVYLRLSYDGAGLWTFRYGTDGVTWVDHSAVTRAFTPTHVLAAFTSTTPLTAGTVYVGKVVDLLATGSTDVRNAVPAVDATVLSTLTGADTTLPAGWVDDSANGDTVARVTSPTPAWRFTSDAALVGSRARLQYTGQGAAWAALLVIVRANTFSASNFATWFLGADLGALDVYVRGHGYGLEVGQTARRPIRVDDPTGSNVASVPGTTGLDEKPYGWLRDATGTNMGTGTPVRAFELRRYGGDGAWRYRCREWAAVLGSTPAETLALTKAAAPSTWDLYDGHDETERPALYTPTIVLAHNNPSGGLTGSTSMDLIAAEFSSLAVHVDPDPDPDPDPEPEDVVLVPVAVAVRLDL